MRLLILIVLAYVGYRLFKTVAGLDRPRQVREETDTQAPVDDVMVQDPFCKAYFPQRRGVKHVIGGKTYYFCSPSCRDQFVEASKNPEA